MLVFLQALTDCGVLDVLAPPYDFDHGRPCNYFCVVPRPVGKADADVKQPHTPPGKACDSTGAVRSAHKEDSTSASSVARADGAGDAAAAGDAEDPQYVYLLACPPPDDFFTVRRPWSGPCLERPLGLGERKTPSRED